jgi:hypothetical protein
VTHAPAPSADEIVRLYKSGQLSAELASYHELEEGEDDPFIRRCIALHNNGEIDLVSVHSEPVFSGLTGHAFFTLQHFYCEAIPKLVTSATTLMEFCQLLIEKAGADLAATQPNIAFRTWCQNNPSEGTAVIREARAGDQLAKRFVTLALQAAHDVDSAIDFVRSYSDDRRLSGMMAFVGMTFPDAAAAQKAISVLESFVADRADDHVRGNALLAAFDVFKKHNDPETTKRLIEAAAKEPGPEMLHGLAQVVWLHHDSLNDKALETALLALEAVNPEHLGTVRILDLGLQRLLGTKSEALALDLLAAKLRDGKLTTKNFETTAHGLTHGDPQRLYALVVRWFLSGSIELCSNISQLVGIDRKRAFDTAVPPLGLTAVQQVFLCRKAIGFLFIKPVICCSILVSVLRLGDKDVEGPVAELCSILSF